MPPPDRWSKGTGVTHFKGADRYDNVASPTAATAEHEKSPPPQSVHEILAPSYSHGRGPPSYESKESYDKGPMVPQ